MVEEAVNLLREQIPLMGKSLQAVALAQQQRHSLVAAVALQWYFHIVLVWIP
jgi:hypothetical protein